MIGVPVMDHYNTNYARHLLGIGFDNLDGHRRITKGEYFHLIGGSEKTHGKMQEKTLELVETLGKRGKTIITASDEEFFETVLELGFKPFSPENN